MSTIALITYVRLIGWPLRKRVCLDPAKSVPVWTAGKDFPDRRFETLYRTPGGRWFIYRSRGGIDNIRPVNRWIAAAWLFTNRAPAEVILRHFPGSVREG